MARRTAVVLAMVLAGSMLAIVSPSPLGTVTPPGPPAANPTVRENAKRGPGAWTPEALAPHLAAMRDVESVPNDELTGPDAGAGGAETPWTDPAPISGYPSDDSLQSGETLQLRLRSTVGNVNIRVSRQGYYGAGVQLDYASQDGVFADAQPIPTPDPTTGLVAANWPVRYQVSTAGWPSGMYLARITQAVGGNGTQYYVPFVVREDSRPSDLLMIIPFATYQAYNGWGGKSLYDYNSLGPNNSVGSTRAFKVSFDRPYDNGNGLGLYFGGDYQMILFLEKEGYDVTYATSSDLDANPNLLTGHKGFVSAFHDEYYSWEMRDTLERGRDLGVGLSFFGANSVYWQIRWENSASGVARRVMVSYKNAAADPVKTNRSTVLFRDTQVGRPENGLMGSQFDNTLGYGQSVPWVVTNATSWFYAGTGLQNGQTIPNLVGYEFDRRYQNGAEPAGLELLSDSPVNHPAIPYVGKHQATAVTAASGALVFNAATNYWPTFLVSGFLGVGPPDARVQQMTRNVLDRMVKAPKVAAGATYKQRVLGTNGIPGSGVAAVALNVTATQPDTSGFITVFPCGTLPNASSVNFPAGQTVPNAVIATVDGNGDVCFYTSSRTHLLVDVSGWFPSNGSGLQALTPTRILDSRTGTGAPVGLVQPAGSTPSIVRNVLNAAGVPGSGVKAVALNVTVTAATAGGYVSVVPCGSSPLVSSLNFSAGQTRANLVVTPVDPSGNVCFFTSAPTHLIVDITGWFPVASGGFQSLAPTRLTDTRTGSPVAAGGTVSVPLGSAGVPGSGVGAVTLNVTAVGPDATGFLTVYPCGAIPNASNVNFVAGDIVPNAVIAPVSADNRACVATSARTHLLVDISGWLPSSTFQSIQPVRLVDTRG